MNDKDRAFALFEKREYKVTESNQLAQQQYITKKSKGTAPTLSEEKAFAYIVSRIKPTDTTLAPIEFDIKEFCDVCGLTAQQYYSHVKETLSNLMSRQVWIKKDNGKEDGYPYLIHVGIDAGSGKGTVEIHNSLVPFLVNLNGNFYQFTFHSILAMKSVYGIRLYKLLKSLYYKTRDATFDLETLKGYLDCADKYDDYRNFRRRVLDPALKDINEYSDIQVEMETVKTSYRVTGLVFHMIDLTREAMPEDIDEANRRHRNVDREIDPDQFFFAGIFDGIGDCP